MNLLILTLVTLPLCAQYISLVTSVSLELTPIVGFSTEFPEHAPGARVHVNPNRINLNGNLGCLEVDRVRLDIYPLGVSQAYPARLIATGCFGMDAVLPSTLPLGPAEAILTSGTGQKLSGYIRVVPFRMGIITEAGMVPGNQLTHPFTPGSSVVLRTTGVGNTPWGELQVKLSSMTLPVRDFRRSATEPGIDELEFIVPADSTIAACYAELSVAAGSERATSALISVMPSDSPCVHPLGIPVEQLAELDAGGSLVVGELSLRRTGTEGASLNFRWMQSGEIARLTGPQNESQPAAGCSFPLVPGTASVTFLNVNQIPWFSPGVSAIHLEGPGQRRFQLVPRLPQDRFYTADLSREDNEISLVQGQWTLAAESNSSIERIHWEFYLPPSWRPETLVRERTIEWRWNPDEYREGDVLSLLFANTRESAYCVAGATEGILRAEVPVSFEIPADLVKASVGTVYRPYKPIVQPLNLPGGRRGIGLINYNLRN
jgi:hypothetical protein